MIVPPTFLRPFYIAVRIFMTAIDVLMAEVTKFTSLDSPARIYIRVA